MKLFALILAITGTACAQLPDAPKPQPKPNWVDRTLISSEITLRILDAQSTHRFENNPCACFHEMDPIAPNAKEWAPTIAFQAAAGAAVIVGYKLLKRHGHPKLARALLIADIVDESIAVGNNYNLHTKAIK